MKIDQNIFKFFLTFFLFIALSLVVVTIAGPNRVYAANCFFSLSPQLPAYDPHSTIGVVIASPSDPDFNNSGYSVQLVDNSGILITVTDGVQRVPGQKTFNVDLSNLDQTRLLLNDGLVIKAWSPNPPTGLIPCTGTNGQTSIPIVIGVQPPPGSCTITLNPSSNITAGTFVSMQVINFSGADGTYTLKIYDGSTAVKSQQINITSGKSSPLAVDGTSVGITPGHQGTYSASLFDLTGNPVTPGCASNPFIVTGNLPPPGLGVGQNPCVGGSCNTALGNISTDPTAFAGKILSIAIGLAGGIALILMVIGSIRVLTSSGDQQRLSAGRDMIVAAVAGLLFLIFSIIILKFVGVQILNIPGFG